ncbi:MAG: RNA methyltransferase [Bacteroidales bacterium]|nr:RNA methyltransferase [Bacteroidales bacterium]
MRRRHGLFVAEGRKCVEDTLGIFSLRYVVCTQEYLESNPFSDIKDSDIFIASRDTIKKISSLSTPPEVLAVYEIPDSEELPRPEVDALSLVLDGVQDPGNLGTIVRAAHWFGVKRIYCSNDTVDIYNPKSIMATMGSAGHVEIFYCDIDKFLSSVDSSIPIYATLLDGDDIYRQPLSAGGIIIMGNEGKGISDVIKRHVTRLLTIPPGDKSDHAESLNVGVATAVVLSQFRSR